MFVTKIGIDLGTANTLVFLPKKGVIINEPTVVAVSIDDNRVLAVGNEARAMIGRTPENIVAYRPLKDGVIADYRITQAMIRYFIEKAAGRFRFFRPEVMVSIPAGASSTERRAVIDATVAAGAKAAYVVKQPVLAAIGAGISINEPIGSMVIDIGGGTSQVAVISLGGIVAWAATRIGGNRFDQAIAEYIKKKHNLAVGDRTAEEIKLAIGTAMIKKDEKIMIYEVKGRDLISGLPKVVAISSTDIVEAISSELQEVVRVVRQVFADTPPELSADIINNGIVLTGGGCLLRNLGDLISRITGVPTALAEDPMLCVAKGTGAVLNQLNVYKKTIMTKK